MHCGLKEPRLGADRSVRISWDFLCGFTNLRLAGVGLATHQLRKERLGDHLQRLPRSAGFHHHLLMRTRVPIPLSSWGLSELNPEGTGRSGPLWMLSWAPSLLAAWNAGPQSQNIVFLLTPSRPCLCTEQPLKRCPHHVSYGQRLSHASRVFSSGTSLSLCSGPFSHSSPTRGSCGAPPPPPPTLIATLEMPPMGTTA